MANPGDHQHRRDKPWYICIMEYDTTFKSEPHLHILMWKSAFSDERKQQLTGENIDAVLYSVKFKMSQGFTIPRTF